MKTPAIVSSMAERLRELGDVNQDEFYQRSDFTRAEIKSNFPAAIDRARELSHRQIGAGKVAA